MDVTAEVSESSLREMLGLAADHADYALGFERNGVFGAVIWLATTSDGSRALKVAPLSQHDAESLAPESSLVEVLLTLSDLASARPDIAALTIDPTHFELVPSGDAPETHP